MAMPACKPQGESVEGHFPAGRGRVENEHRVFFLSSIALRWNRSHVIRIMRDSGKTVP
jgi:hypothetical protein